MSLKLLTFDLGGSGGKAMLATYDGQRLVLREAGRFPNRPVWMGNRYCWDVPCLLAGVKDILAAVWNTEGPIAAYGIDTWGASFGLVDRMGGLLTLPLHYRGRPYTAAVEKVHARVPHGRLRTLTGCYPSEDITVFALRHYADEAPGLLSLADKLLYMPDLLQFFLTGFAAGECTIAGTGGVLHPRTRTLNRTLLRELDLDASLFPPVREAGTLLGPLSPAVQQELGIGDILAISTAEHDTQAAIAALDLRDETAAYLICGTWSLIGVETDTPCLDEEGLDHGFCNELGVEGTYCYLRNIQGMWLYEQCLAQWGWAADPQVHLLLAEEAAQASPLACLVDTNDPLFYGIGDMPARLAAYCAQTGQPQPQTRGEIIRCIFESLCCQYCQAVAQIERSTGRQIESLRVGGGGSENAFLMQMTADALGCRVLAGPREASSMGNAMFQLVALGQVAGLRQARELAAHDASRVVYEPRPGGAWAEAVERYQHITARYQAQKACPAQNKPDSGVR